MRLVTLLYAGTPKASLAKLGEKVERIVMGNQQRSLSTDFAAGLIVGEGCFYVAEGRRKGQKWTRFIPGFAISMADKITMNLFIEYAKANNLPLYVQIKTPVKGRKEQLRIHVVGLGRTKKWVDHFIPYLTGDKLLAAESVQLFIESRLSKPGRPPYTEEELSFINASRLVNFGKPLRDYM